MKRGYKFKRKENIRYFIMGSILAALAFGSIGIRLPRPDVQEPVQYGRFRIGICEPSRIEHCQPFYHPILRDCDRNASDKLFDTLNTTEVQTSV